MLKRLFLSKLKAKAESVNFKSLYDHKIFLTFYLVVFLLSIKIKEKCENVACNPSPDFAEHR